MSYDSEFQEIFNKLRSHELAKQKMPSYLTTSPPPPPFAGIPSQPVYTSEKLLDMLSMRMRWDGHKHPFGFITAHKTADKVVVFFVQKDEPGYVTDAWDLYPSDTLITQLRLVLG